jgi:hypothetical protein
MSKTSLLLAVLIALMTTSAHGVKIRGAPSCGAWTEDRPMRNLSSLVQQSWLLGFLSALAMETQKDFIAGTDNPSLFLWMDNFCGANPLKDVADGGYQLYTELARQKSK